MTCEEGGGSTGALERATSVARGKPHARNEIFSARLGTLEQGVAPHSRRKGGEGRLARLPHASLNLCNSFPEPCLQSVVEECVLRHQGPRQSVMRDVSWRQQPCREEGGPRPVDGNLPHKWDLLLWH